MNTCSFNVTLLRHKEEHVVTWVHMWFTGRGRVVFREGVSDMANIVSCLIVECRKKTAIVCRGYNTLWPYLSAIRRTVVHRSHNLIRSIGYQSSNSMSSNSLLWSTKSDFTSSHLTCSNTSININMLAFFVRQTLTCLPFHQLTVTTTSASPPSPTVWNRLPYAVREASSDHRCLWQLNGHLFQRVSAWL